MDAEYVVNDRTGEVHLVDCPRVGRIGSTSPWDPAKAALTPGVHADQECLLGMLPLRQAPAATEATVVLTPVDSDGLTAPERAIAEALWCRWRDPEGAPAVRIMEDPRTVAQVAWRAITGG